MIISRMLSLYDVSIEENFCEHCTNGSLRHGHLKIYKSALSLLRTLTMWHCTHSPAAWCYCSVLAMQQRTHVSAAHWAHSSKPATAGLQLWAQLQQTDRWMGGQDRKTLYSYTNSAYYVGSGHLLHSIDGQITRLVLQAFCYGPGKSKVYHTPWEA